MAAVRERCLWVQAVLIVGLLIVFVTTALDRTLSAYKTEDIRRRGDNLFRLKRESGDECLEELSAKGGFGTLTSPNYPENYPNNADCLWLITAEDPNATLSLKIEDLNIEPHKDCRLDFLQVYLGATVEAPSLGPFCGNIYNRLIETNSSKVLLVFHSDSIYQDKGFSVDYFTSDTAADCSETLTEAFGSLRSPGFPDHYPDETECTTLIEVTGDRKILLNFDTVDLEVGEDCAFDYVQIFDGKTKNSTLLGQICQQTDIRSFQSSASSLLVHFHSDNMVNKKGYRARYTSVDPRNTPIGDCQWEPGIDNGTISSPNYPENYPSGSNCSIWILAPEDSVVAITIEASLLEIDRNCSFDFLLISEGPSLASKVLERFCSKKSEPREINSTQNEVLVHFQSDNFLEFSGFKLTYRFVKEKEGNSESVSPTPFDGTLAFSVTPENVTLSKGSSGMLHCNTNHPEAKIRWLKGHIFLGGDKTLSGLSQLPNDTLWIRGMHRQLVGVYTCVAVAPEGELATTAYVFMADEPANESCGVEFQKTPSDSEFEEDNFAYLECRAEGDSSVVSWEKDGVPLEMEDQRIHRLANGYIVMNRIREEDAGLYTCVAVDGTCAKRASAVLKVIERVKIEEICGRGKADLSPKKKLQNEHGKIVGGYDAPKGAYPWQVMLWEPKLKSFCGATLLNERWIATAAHCFKNIKHNISWDKVRIFLGKHDREFKDAEEFETSIAGPSDIVYHPNFVKYTFDNDVALVRLSERVYFTDHIQPVCLGNRNISERLLTGDPDKPRIGTVIGWGKLKENGPSPRYLQEIKLPLVDQDVCRASTDFIVTRNMFCAGYSQEVIGDACYGDSGGPFLMSHEGRWYMVGIVSWGEGCGKQNKYGFYTRIANHLSWIQSVIKS